VLFFSRKESRVVAGKPRDAAVNFHQCGGCRQQTSVRTAIYDLTELKIAPFDPPTPKIL